MHLDTVLDDDNGSSRNTDTVDLFLQEAVQRFVSLLSSGRSSRRLSGSNSSRTDAAEENDYQEARQETPR